MSSSRNAAHVRPAHLFEHSAGGGGDGDGDGGGDDGGGGDGGGERWCGKLSSPLLYGSGSAHACVKPPM